MKDEYTSEEFCNGISKFFNEKTDLETTLRTSQTSGKEGIQALRSLKSKIALVCGAGISATEPFCVPSWENLLRKASITYFYSNEIKPESRFDVFLKANEHFSECNDLYEWAQYLDLQLRSKEQNLPNHIIDLFVLRKLYTIIRKTLYSNLKKDEIAKIDSEYNGFLGSICSLVSKYDIRKIITYNYDDCFEYVWSRKTDTSLKPIFIENQFRSMNVSERYIYHVHGFTPYLTTGAFDGKIHLSEDTFKDLENPEAYKLILTEDSYGFMSDASYKWRNVVQADTFLNNHCLFFGFSASDKNFKRMMRLFRLNEEVNLDGTMKTEINHYIFLPINDYIQNNFSSKEKIALGIENGGKKVNLTKEENKILRDKLKLISVALKNKEDYLRSYKIGVIWTTYQDIHEIINSL